MLREACKRRLPVDANLLARHNDASNAQTDAGLGCLAGGRVGGLSRIADACRQTSEPSRKSEFGKKAHNLTVSSGQPNLPKGSVFLPFCASFHALKTPVSETGLELLMECVKPTYATVSCGCSFTLAFAFSSCAYCISARKHVASNSRHVDSPFRFGCLVP
ncbi:unnamed protein product [Protopolystoma xenopodis]|uniref:Uncharacterized protein n=1 Tax=Protopolystoma xenopodis TaxID=117903 RepID=A0A3S5B013_9PLAT|nr:unnamed protein product [Protopolystoma xenopodis]